MAHVQGVFHLLFVHNRKKYICSSLDTQFPDPSNMINMKKKNRID